MATNCSDGIYTLHYTNLDKNSITINKKTLNQGVIDLALLGRTRREYGEVFDENILHLLENFASYEDTSNPGTPDLTRTYADLLANPIQGQKWYNKTQQRLFTFDGVNWKAAGTIGDVGGNSGIIAHGASLPLPISSSGYHFTYDECTWIVSMFNFPDQTDYALCTTNASGVVTSQYRVAGTATMINGYAFYQILGLRGVGSDALPTPTPTPTQTRTPTVTPTISRSATPVPSPTVTPSLTASLMPSPTPSVTLSQFNVITLPVNNVAYGTHAPAVQDPDTAQYLASASVNFTFKANGTYSISTTANGITTTPTTGTWLPAGEIASNYRMTYAFALGSSQSSDFGTFAVINDADASSAMTSDYNFSLSTAFTYPGAQPGSALGASIAGTLTTTLLSVSTGKKVQTVNALASSTN